MWQPPELAGEHALDEQRYRAGQPNIYDVVPAGIPL